MAAPAISTVSAAPQRARYRHRSHAARHSSHVAIVGTVQMLLGTVQLQSSHRRFTTIHLPPKAAPAMASPFVLLPTPRPLPATLHPRPYRPLPPLPPPLCRCSTPATTSSVSCALSRGVSAQGREGPRVRSADRRCHSRTGCTRAMAMGQRACCPKSFEPVCSGAVARAFCSRRSLCLRLVGWSVRCGHSHGCGSSRVTWLCSSPPPMASGLWYCQIYALLPCDDTYIDFLEARTLHTVSSY